MAGHRRRVHGSDPVRAGLPVVRLVAFTRRPGEYVLIEAFVDGQAGGTHVESPHFKQAQQDLPPHLSATPKILSFEADADGWSDLGELTVSG